MKHQRPKTAVGSASMVDLRLVRSPSRICYDQI